MNVLSLFTGVGGFDLGLERAGHTIVGQVEWDQRCQAILRKHWPDVPLHGDITTYEPTGQADLVCGGFPCQDLSVAGRRAGLAGERSGLFFEAARIADAVLGAGGWVLIENVPGLLSSNGGRDFALVLASLADLGFYDLAWRVLDSQYFGVPQRRRRAFILGRRDRGRRAAQVLCEPEGEGRDWGAGQSAVGQAPEANGSLSPPYADRVGEAPRVSRRVDNPVIAFHATQTPISGTISPALGSNAQIGVTRGGEDRATCAYDPKPDGPRYAQMGNAVTVNVAEWIGHRLARFA